MTTECTLLPSHEPRAPGSYREMVFNVIQSKRIAMARRSDGENQIL